MSEEFAVYECRLLYVHRDKIVWSLRNTDFFGFVKELCKRGVVTQEVGNAVDDLHFDSGSVDSALKARYLLQLITDKVHEDSKYFKEYLKILEECGGEVKKIGKLLMRSNSEVVIESAQLQYTDRCLTEQDIPALVENLVEVAQKWEEISIALNIPPRVCDMILEI